MPAFWKITNRTLRQGQPVGPSRGELCYLIRDDPQQPWQRVSAARFDTLLKAAADRFDPVPEGANVDQKHVTLLIHGYNTSAPEADALYHRVCRELYSGPDSLGLCVSFDWPSLGHVLGYYPDREHARRCAGDLADVLDRLYRHLLTKQEDAQSLGTAKLRGRAPRATACKAKISLIAHSMGNYLVQKALSTVWTRENEPRRVTLVNQLLMVAADVDNDLFNHDADDATDGLAMVNLTYRITALFSGRDNVLGASAGLKHFGARRLGRSGLATEPPASAPGRAVDNVWQVDCSRLLDPAYDDRGGLAVHGAYFEDPDTLALLREILRGADRRVLEARGLTHRDKWPVRSG